MSDNMQYWNKLHTPPPTALKAIEAGRLKGKSDINPQWRYQAMTETFGPCGIGWRYEIAKLWTEPATEGQVFAFAQVNVYVRHDGEWSTPVPGVGGSMLIEKERAGLHDSDEGFKMAVTDALSVALKMFGVAAEVYLGNYDGSKYRKPATPTGNASPLSTAQVSEKDAEYHTRIKTALHTIYGADRTAALNKVEELTSFVPKGKTESDRVKGVRDFTKLTGQRVQILAHKLEDILDKRSDMEREPGEEG